MTDISKHVSPELLRKVGQVEHPPDSATPGCTKIPIIVVYHSDEELGQSNSFVTKSITQVLQSGGNPAYLISTVLFAWFSLADNPTAEEDCKATAKALQQILACNGKILYGRAAVAYGNFGSPTRIHAGPFIKHVGTLLKLVNNMKFGDIQELPEMD